MSDKTESPLPKWLTGSLPVLLSSKIYSSVIKYRNVKYDKNPHLTFKSSFPVISIGGIRAGGTGKTPLTQYIAQYLSSLNFNVAILSRGYRRKSTENKIVHPFQTVHWQDVGDEPAMIHTNVPKTFLAIGAKRVQNVQKLEQLVPPNTVMLLDDGFQHRKLKRDLDIVCLNESILSDKLLPCGYLREPLSSLHRAQALVVIGSPERLPKLQNVASALNDRFPQIPIFTAIQSKDCWVDAVTGETHSTLPTKSPVAFCGIARPYRFFDLLSSEGINPVKQITYPDHHNFTHYDIEYIQKLYSHGLVTTEKDAIRLMNNSFDPKLKFWYLKIKLQFENDASLNRFNSLISTIMLHI